MNAFRPTALMAGIAALFAPALASAQVAPISTIDQTEHLASLSIDSVTPALQVTTANQIVAATEAGDEYLVATAANGLTFQIQFQGCEDGPRSSCLGMVLLALWDNAVDDGATFAERNRAFALSHPLVTSGPIDGANAYVARYVIADFGAPQGNIVSEFSNFVRNATEFQNIVIAGVVPEESPE